MIYNDMQLVQCGFKYELSLREIGELADRHDHEYVDNEHSFPGFGVRYVQCGKMWVARRDEVFFMHKSLDKSI